MNIAGLLHPTHYKKSYRTDWTRHSVSDITKATKIFIKISPATNQSELITNKTSYRFVAYFALKLKLGRIMYPKGKTKSAWNQRLRSCALKNRWQCD